MFNLNLECSDFFTNYNIRKRDDRIEEKEREEGELAAVFMGKGKVKEEGEGVTSFLIVSVFVVISEFI